MIINWKVTVLIITGLLIIGFIAAGLYINTIGLNNVKLMYELNNNKGAILKMESEGEYLTKANHKSEKLKNKMNSEGWTFVNQEGAGYFFEKNGQEIIITTRQIWNRHFVVYKVTDNVLDLST
ncbi:hypothetical protein HGI30_20070 [Paenibacillus albicereus]|uniref:Uncharacterized protein n=1 Tax=Paenibacillus albicereus TaxID=2726185 RepID=A0A6H2H1N5_9BACL|nr:hypothetical protein [Paenibacillus albicereus]QJC53601.1 hypothetical protein HGI30_20070 [Paenibacillus albicereus]